MGILSDEQYDEMVSKMEAASSGDELSEVAAQADDPQQSDDSTDSNQAEDGSSSDAEDVKEEVEASGDDSEPEVPKVPESVPYGRFREVNEKFRSRERELEKAQQRIQSLEQMTLQQAQAGPQGKSADEWLDELLDAGEPEESAELKSLKADLQSVKSWQKERTHQLVSSQLEVEISTAVEKHPEVSAEELWQAVAADGTVDVDAVATHIQQGREQMRSRYTADAQEEVAALKAQLAEAQKAATEASAFRRPGTSATPPPSGGDRPRTVAQATEAFAEAIRERMSQ